MKKILTILALASCCLAKAQTQRTFDIDLWPNGLPNTNGIDSKPFDDSKQNFKPSIRVALPTNPNGKAVVACPGGGYSHLAKEHEGYDWAEFFNKRGIALITVTYRMPHNNKEVPISDVNEAFRVVRDSAKVWNINPKKVGIMGSSAGGHLASTIATHTLKKNAPAFQILFYPVISMDEKSSHKGSCRNFLSNAPTQHEINTYSNDRVVTKKTPPAIVMLSLDDTVVPPSNGIDYAVHMNECGAQATLLTFPTGGHGWGYRSTFAHHEEMLDGLSIWLENL